MENCSSGVEDGQTQTPAGTVPSAAASFALIAWFWWAHIAWSKHSQLNNRATVVLNLLLVFLVLIYMFPLRLMFGELFSALTGGWLPSPFTAPLDTRGLIALLAVYGLAVTSMSACIAALYLLTLRERRELGTPRSEVLEVSSYLIAFCAYTAAGILALASLAALVNIGRTGTSALLFTTSFYFLAIFNGLIQMRVRRAADRLLVHEPETSSEMMTEEQDREC